MTQLFIQLIQSVTGAVLTIIGLLLVAAIIGYFSAWFYAKSIYTPIIKELETDKEQLQKEVAGLRNDIVSLNEQADKLRDKITGLEKEVEAKAKEIKDLTKSKKQL
jgi:peptidoglycan hydrolase CwlO-like protein